MKLAKSEMRIDREIGLNEILKKSGKKSLEIG